MPPRSASITGSARAIRWRRCCRCSRAPQGNRILLIDLVKDTAQVRLIPARFEPLGLDAQLGRPVLPQQVERQVTQGREVLGAVALAHAALILTKGDIEHPMDRVLD